MIRRFLVRYRSYIGGTGLGAPTRGLAKDKLAFTTLFLASRRRPTYLAHMSAYQQPDPDETPAQRRTRLSREAKLIEEARTSVTCEGTVPAEEVEAWVASWDTPNELPRPAPRK